MANIYEQVKQALQDIVAPKIREERGEIEGVRTEIRRLDERIDGLDGRIGGLDEKLVSKIDSLRSEVTTEIRRLDEKIVIGLELREKIAALEAKIAALTDK
ncbi:MAG: hypothetical protein DRJ31_08830 [Candidatus Methanomethylicota archaeon]|uniref:DUF1640 domain-containing protein n=1 Tax=Thermoproteota archaeon TaxID=2056631 RepID=A0A497EL15_9CREN|nr:MAG: hypothetical protein DRJ31_08830 [Candidatus Verstraetearchaeota archaeon]